MDAHTEINVEFFDSKEYEFSDEEKKTVIAITISAEKEIRILLPQLPEIILLSVMTGQDVIATTGEVGLCMAPGYVRWIVDPKLKESVNEIAKASLRSTLFHECHHLVRGFVMYGGKPIRSFMDVVINEGLATVFERDASGSNPEWGRYPADVENWVNELQQLPLSVPYEEWMIRHPDGRSYIGYKVGTYIVDRAIKNSGVSAADFVLTTTEEIFELSGLK